MQKWQTCFKVIFGGAQEAASLLKIKFDYIFSTCSSRIGRKVMAAAAENLTPVTLELGGKWYKLDKLIVNEFITMY